MIRLLYDVLPDFWAWLRVQPLRWWCRLVVWHDWEVVYVYSQCRCTTRRCRKCDLESRDYCYPCDCLRCM